MSAVIGVILAGGLARRMGGGHKGLQLLGGRPILAHVIERLGPQVAALVLNVNGEAGAFASFGLPIAPDTVPGFAGPLAGVLAGLRWAQAHWPQASDIVTVPGDGPFLPLDLVTRLAEARTAKGADLACAVSNEQPYPVVGLWPLRLADDLEQAMVEVEIRKVDVWTARHRLVQVAFASSPVDPFFNINRPEDLDLAERLLAGVG